MSICRGPGHADACAAEERAVRRRCLALVAMAAVAILAAVALRRHGDAAVRDQLVDGTSALAGLRARLESYHRHHRTYLTVSEGIVSPCDTLPAGAAGTFHVQCMQVTATTYFLAAQGSGVTQGFVYTTDTRNTQVTAGLPARWGANPPYPCWITRRGDAC
jgi:type IV pilus assembly protein PilE